MSCDCGPLFIELTTKPGLVAGGSAVLTTNFENAFGGIRLNGKAEITTSQVYDGYSQVFHLVEQGAGIDGEFVDSTHHAGATAGNPPANPTRTGGPNLYSQSFDSVDYIVIPSDQLGDSTDLTVSMWARTTSRFLPRVFYSRGRTDAINNEGWQIEFGHDSELNLYCSLQLVNPAGRWVVVTATAEEPLSSACWYHVAFTWDRHEIVLYIDGEEIISKTTPLTTFAHATQEGNIGRRDKNKNMIGNISEFRLTPEIKSEAWLDAEFQNLCREGLETIAEHEFSPTYN